MCLLISKLFLRSLPLIYMCLIWLQSDSFNPGAFFNHTAYLDMKIILLMGIGLELGHLFEFGFLYLFIILAFLTYGTLNIRKEVMALIISIIYGLIDEIHQFYIPFRSATYIDLVKNTIGVFAFWFLIHKSYFKTNKSKIGYLLRHITNLFTIKKHKYSE